MKKILIISGGSLPVPAVRGGAVETLIDSITERNEEEPVFDIGVVSCADRQARRARPDYRHTRWHFISCPWPIRLFDYLNGWYTEKLLHDWRSMFIRNREKGRYYAKKAASRLPLTEYDAVIVENNMSLLSAIADAMGEEYSRKCYFHMHSSLVDNPAMLPFLAGCRKLLVVSDYVRRELYGTYPELSDTVIEKVTNGIRTENPAEGQTEEVSLWKESREKQRQALRQRYGLREGERVILYSGRLSPEKGVLELVRAFCGTEREEAVLLLAGSAFSGDNTENDYVKQLRRAAEPAGRHVIFAGYIPHGEMAGYYRMADCLAVPSIVGDAAPLTVLEGMAEGMFLIASRVGGIPEYTEQYGAKLLVRHDEAFGERLKNALETFLLMDPREYAGQEPQVFSDREFFRSFVQALAGDGGPVSAG